MKPLVAEFDRCWPGVTRTREVLVLAEEFADVAACLARSPRA